VILLKLREDDSVWGKKEEVGLRWNHPLRHVEIKRGGTSLQCKKEEGSAGPSRRKTKSLEEGEE